MKPEHVALMISLPIALVEMIAYGLFALIFGPALFLVLSKWL